MHAWLDPPKIILSVYRFLRFGYRVVWEATAECQSVASAMGSELSALSAASGSIMSLILQVKNAARQPKVWVGDGVPPILKSYIKVGVHWVEHLVVSPEISYEVLCTIRCLDLVDT